VYLTLMSASVAVCYLHAAPFSGKNGLGVPRGVAGPRREPGPAAAGGSTVGGP
jgi:hypothetical protein